MKHLITCLSLLFFISYTANSQKLSEYNKHINEAELLIADSQFAKALPKYKDAFRVNAAATTKDYYNAAVCAVVADNNKLAFTYLSELGCRGIPLQKLTAKKVLAPLLALPEWQKFADQYEQNTGKCIKQINQAYRDTLLAMVKTDQYYHRIRAELASKESEPELLSAYVDSIKYITDKNTDAFLKLVAKNGFPSESKVGATEPGVNTFYEALLRHAVQQGRQDILPVLRKAAENGDLSPHIYAHHAEYPDNKTYGTNVLMGSPNKMEEVKFAPEVEARINKERAMLGMETLDELKKKARFSMTDRRFYINKPNATVTLFFSREDAAKSGGK